MRRGSARDGAAPAAPTDDAYEGQANVTAAEILKAGALARGEIVELPTDETARMIIKSAAKARGETDPEKPL